jgi:hypothetical protein
VGDDFVGLRDLKSSYKQATDFEGVRNNDRSKLRMKGRSIEGTRNKINEQSARYTLSLKVTL